MGVKGLSKLLQIYGEKVILPHADNLIMDGNNLIHVIGSRHIARLRATYQRSPTTPEDFLDDIPDSVRKKMISLTISQQIKYLTQRIVTDVVEFISTMTRVYGIRKIIMMTDPYVTDYIITRESIIGVIDESHVSAIIEGDHQVVALNIKAEEQTARSKTNTRCTSDETFFVDRINLIGLAEYVYAQLLLQIPEMEIYVAKSEADIAIRMLCKNIEREGESAIVVSTDSDYYILLADIANMYVYGSFRNYDKPYSVKQFWDTMFGESYSYPMLCRIAPLLGNDYTVHNFIVNDKNTQATLRILFGMEGNISELMAGKAIKIKSLVQKMQQLLSRYPDMARLTLIDEAMKRWGDIKSQYMQHYIGYVRSIVVYMNYEIHGEYRILTPREPSISMSKYLARRSLSFTPDEVITYESEPEPEHEDDLHFMVNEEELAGIMDALS